MSIWMQLVLAFSCLMAVLTFGTFKFVDLPAAQIFTATLFVFVIGLAVHGIRRPVA